MVYIVSDLGQDTASATQQGRQSVLYMLQAVTMLACGFRDMFANRHIHRHTYRHAHYGMVETLK